ncbi:MAG TPA: glycoside hydrolase family 3 N-terminal domain-containing protein [Candidatus Nanoarchaeia archaeon]|nr:glycoside hydrolase family 3 N-terminal domain-containing protein [Candidatus Nanoarchaeia archaeon]
MKRRKNRPSPILSSKGIFFILLAVVLILGTLNLLQAKGLFIPSQPKPLVENGVVDLDRLTLEQKIAQMTVVLWVPDLMPAWKNLQMGGLYMYALATENYFRSLITELQQEMVIPFFITADAEGCFNPFENFWDFLPNNKIATVGEAFEKGFREGQEMKDLGFNLNFAPVVDLGDEIWKCRSFPGSEVEVAELAQAYTLGLQTQGIKATAKHYPGKTLIGKDPHKNIAEAEIEAKDLYPYYYLIEKGDVSSIMVSHLITTGEVDSQGVPSVVSVEVIEHLRQQFPGLIISDEIHMLGLKNYYATVDEMYIALFKAGNDLILNFDKDPNEVYRMIQVIKASVEAGDISEDHIDASVKKILEAKGFVVKD